jgi:hypothetical protein
VPELRQRTAEEIPQRWQQGKTKDGEKRVTVLHVPTFFLPLLPFRKDHGLIA